MRKIIIILLILAPVVISCTTDSFEKDFIKSTGNQISLTVNGTRIFSFNDKFHQIAYNSIYHQFRAHDDSFTKYFVIQFDRVPTSIGETVTASLEYTDLKKKLVKKENLQFQASKIVRDNNKKIISVWNDSENIGIVFRHIE